VKTSRPYTRLSKNVAAWDSQCYEQLIREYPWLSKYSCQTHINASSEDGYGVGAFVVRSAQLPSTGNGNDRINSISIPIIIKESKLAPLDIFQFRDQAFPLNEDRVVSILRSAHTFVENDRDIRKLENLPRSNYRSPHGGLFGKHSSYEGTLRYFKTSTKRALKFKLNDLQRDISHLKSVSLSHDLDGIRKLSQTNKNLMRTLMAATEGVPLTSVEKQSAAVMPYVDEAILCGIEVKPTLDGLMARDYWYSDPETGRRKISEFQAITPHDLIKTVGAEAARTALKEGLWIDTLEKHSSYDLPRSISQVADGAVRDELMGHADLDFFKTSGAATPGKKYLFINPKEGFGLPDRFEGWVVNGAPHTGYVSREGILTDFGTLLLTNSFRISDLTAIAVEAEGNLTSLPTITTVYAAYSAEGDHSLSKGAAKVAVWVQEGGIHCVKLQGGVTVEGKDGTKVHQVAPMDDWLSSDMNSSGTTTVAVLGSKFKTMMTESKNDEIKYYLPKAEVFTVPFGNVPRADRTPSAVPVPPPITETKESGAVPVTVSLENGLWSVDHPFLKGVLKSNNLTEDGAYMALKFSGFAEDQVSTILGQTKVSGAMFFHSVPPDIGQGANLVKEASALASDAQKSVDTFFASMPRGPLLDIAMVGHPYSIDRSKVSGAIVGMSVDSALSLNFLKPETLMKFVDMRPCLDEAISKLCSLLIASRLGLTEIKSQDLEMAVNGLEPVLSGLRVLEMTLRG